jgi:hypothetical protein
MIVGFNHNVSYRGVGFHVQTEDSGVKSPQLVTLLYHGGTIIASQKTVYADILKVENLSQVVEDLAKEQHKGMLRRLTQGEFDQKIITFGIELEGVVAAPKPDPEPVAEIPVPPAPPVEVVAPEVVEELPETKPLAPVPPVPPVTIVEEPIVDKFRESKEKCQREPSLDALIYAYLSGADEC